MTKKTSNFPTRWHKCYKCGYWVALKFIKTVQNKKKRFRCRGGEITLYPYANNWDSGPPVTKLISPHMKTLYSTKNVYKIPKHEIEKEHILFKEKIICEKSDTEITLDFKRTKGRGRSKVIRMGIA